NRLLGSFGELGRIPAMQGTAGRVSSITGGTGMKLRYFLVDANGQIRKVSQSAVLGLWHGQRRAHATGPAPGTGMRLVSVACDDRPPATKLFLLRLALTKGEFPPENRTALAPLLR